MVFHHYPHMASPPAVSSMMALPTSNYRPHSGQTPVVAIRQMSCSATMSVDHPSQRASLPKAARHQFPRRVRAGEHRIKKSQDSLATTGGSHPEVRTQAYQTCFNESRRHRHHGMAQFIPVEMRGDHPLRRIIQGPGLPYPQVM